MLTLLYLHVINKSRKLPLFIQVRVCPPNGLPEQQQKNKQNKKQALMYGGGFP
jgi:hypothetical protein